VLYANYIYVFISGAFAYALSNSEHRDFLKQHFSLVHYKKTIVFANLLKVTPFALFLLYKTYVVEVLLVYAIAFFISFIPKRGKLTMILPTPFGKKPAEFVIGFRKTVWLFLLVYGFAIIAVYVGNFNLGAFALILSIFYLDQIHVILLLLSMGCLYLSMYVLIRYAFQHQGLEILQAVIGGLCILFPPVMIIAIPYFYKKAIQNLNLLLK